MHKLEAIVRHAFFVLSILYLNACKPAEQESTSDVVALTGNQIFMSKCTSCHQADGSGLPGVCAPLASSPRLVDAPEKLVKIVLLGMRGTQIRDGITYKGIMPAWRFDLTDSQIAAVLNDMLLRWRPGTSEISTDLVKSIREQTASQKLFITPEELDSIPAK